MVNAPPMCAVASARVERLVVDEAFELRIDGIAYTNFFCVSINDFAPWVFGKEALEAGGAVAVVGLIAAS